MMIKSNPRGGVEGAERLPTVPRNHRHGIRSSHHQPFPPPRGPSRQSDLRRIRLHRRLDVRPLHHRGRDGGEIGVLRDLAEPHHYLTGHLGQSTASAAAGLNTWFGVASMMPLLGAFVAESYLGRYRTIAIASLLYVLGLGMLTLSAILPEISSELHIALFYLSLYLVAIAQGGHKPCVQAFGADQFDENNPIELTSRSSFFNWWYFGMNSGLLVSLLILPYVQDNIGWGLGFGIPCILMIIALVVFLLGTKTYRYYLLDKESPFIRIGRTFIALLRREGAHPKCSYQRNDVVEGGEEAELFCSSNQSKLGEVSSGLGLKQVEEAKGVLGLFPIWATCLTYAIIFAQSSTFFTKQGSTMDRRIGSSFQVPPATLQSIISIAILVFIPIYDRVIVPIARKTTKRPSGVSPLQRIGAGIFVSTLSMVVSALVEMKRLRTAKDFGLIDQPDVAIPLSLWWLFPQYILFGVSDVLAMVGLQEFFYDQVPDSLRSLGLALYLSIFGVGSFISSFLVSVIDMVTKSTGDSWFSNNLNRGHLDYFYWLLAGLNSIGLVIFIYFANLYVCKKKYSGPL